MTNDMFQQIYTFTVETFLHDLVESKFDTLLI